MQAEQYEVVKGGDASWADNWRESIKILLIFFIEKRLAQSNISGGQQLLLVSLGPRNPCSASEAVYDRWTTEKDGHAILLSMIYIFFIVENIAVETIHLI